MATWKIAAVQMDCVLGNPAANRTAIDGHLRTAAAAGARLAIFPECAWCGYCFTSKAEALPFAETIPGPATDHLAALCRELKMFAIVGLLEKEPSGNLYNAAVLVGPQGLVGSYRKVHLPFLGVDRFTSAGDRPF